METGASRSPEKTGQEGRIVMENAFASMKTITLPRACGTEQQSVFVCVNGRTFQVPRGKAVEVRSRCMRCWKTQDGSWRRHGSSRMSWPLAEGCGQKKGGGAHDHPRGA